MEELRGVVKKLIFASDDGRFSVFLVEDSDTKKVDSVAFQGSSPYVGENVILRGCWHQHPRFGVQFKAFALEMVKPEAEEEVIHFLSSGLIQGIKESMAKKIVAHFGKETMDVLENHIESLLDVPGIGGKTFQKIKASYEEIAALREVIMYLQSLGISEVYAKEMQRCYKEDIMENLQKNPYELLRKIPDMTFAEVDRIALDQGTAPDELERVICGLYYGLAVALSRGYSCVPEDLLVYRTTSLLQLSEDIIRKGIEEATSSQRIPFLIYEDRRYLYLPALYDAETESAARLHFMKDHQKELGSAKLAIEKFERENGITLADEQKNAVEEALRSQVMVITGGPGTGKTTLVRAIIMAAQQYGAKVRLMAPTGRAAKRLAISSGVDADTIHKALEAERRDGDKTVFNKNDSDMLKEDFIIVDEASMMDVNLFYHLLLALKEDARLILVGDADQLPPVGPGNPLKSIIAWDEVPVVRLSQIFRQEEGSGIIENAARIRQGDMIEPEEEGDFQVVRVNSDEEAYQKVLEICRAFHYDEPEEKMAIQVLSPMYRGDCGVDRLNHAIQEMVHGRFLSSGVRFLVGDKVMQKRNDYDKGVYNGDVGTVWGVTEKKVMVSFYDKEVAYEGEERNDLQLAYATTVHKAQGSEYDTVIFVLLPSQPMMLKRNLLYTGVTRAKKNSILITTDDAIRRALATEEIGQRYSLFLPILKGETKEER